MILDWSGNPYAAAPSEPYGVEQLYCLSVLCGTRPFAASDYTDDRLRIVALIGEGYRARRQVPTPERIVQILELLALPSRGALRWIRDLVNTDAADDQAFAAHRARRRLAE